jgi:acetate kinase
MTINGGSSSLKFSVFSADGTFVRILEGRIERIGLPACSMSVTGLSPADNFSKPVTGVERSAAVACLMDWIQDRFEAGALIAVGHRVVQGGPEYWTPQRITAAFLADYRQLTAFDPEHAPQEILLIEAFQTRFPQLVQIACFDTEFHHDLPRIARLLPLPRRFEAHGLRRYGFHGLSYSYLLDTLGQVAGAQAAHGRVIMAHLGSGASMAAVSHARCIDTTMGFTPASGLMMGTRCGDIDPGVASFLARSEHMSPAQFDHVVNHESGLLGVSETSSDMRDLLRLEASDVRAAEAIDLFCYQAKKWIGAYAAALGGIDTLIFAGGIGENVPTIRARICQGLSFLGIACNATRNMDNAAVISDPDGQVTIRVMRTDEELMIARSTSRVLDSAVTQGRSPGKQTSIYLTAPFPADAASS